MADAEREAIAILLDKNVIEDMLSKLEAKINQTVLEEISMATKPLCAKIEKLELRHEIYTLIHFSGNEQRLDEAEQRLEYAEQYSCRACLRIYSIPLLKSFESMEDCPNKVTEVFKEIEVEVPDGVIDWVHHAGKEVKKNQAMIVKFTTRKYKTAEYNGKKRLQDKRTQPDFTSESWTFENSEGTSH